MERDWGTTINEMNFKKCYTVWKTNKFKAGTICFRKLAIGLATV